MAVHASGRFWVLTKTAYREWREDKARHLAAALSYYTAISVAPLLVLGLTIAGFFVDADLARQELSAQFHGILGAQGAELLTMVLKNAERPQLASVAGVSSVLVLIWGASNVFAQLQDALNTIWNVELKPNAGMWVIIRERFLSFGMVLAIGFVLLVSLILSAVIAFLSGRFSHLLPGLDSAWQLANLAVSFLVTTLVFGLMYKVLPEVKVAWQDVWIGAIVTAVLFTVGKYVLSLYFGFEVVSSAYGAAGSLVVFLIWVYFSAQIFFLGAEFTQVYARSMGHGLEPVEYTRLSVSLLEEQIEHGSIERRMTRRPQVDFSKTDGGQ
jgi:membrane protein